MPGKGQGRSELEQLAHFKELEREFLGEAADDPTRIGALLDQSEAGEAVQIVADGDGRDVELAGELEPIDLLVGLAIAA